MQPRIVKFLLLAFAVVSGLLLAGGEARAATFSYTMTLDSITSSDFTKTATYTYTFTQGSGSSTISYVDFAIPVEISIPVGAFSGANSKFSVTVNGLAVGGEVYEMGNGDLGTHFAIGDTRVRVLKANIPNSNPSFTIVLTLRGQTFSSGRRFADAGQSDLGVVLSKAGNGTNTQTFVIQTPTVVDPPAYPRPVFSNFSVYPNPVVVPKCSTVSWTLSDPLATVSINPPVTVSGNQASICPAAAGTYPYTITATGPGGSTTESFSITAVNAPPPPLLVSFSFLPNPVTAGEDLTVTWDRADATVSINPSTAVEIYGDQAYATIHIAQDAVPGTHEYTIMATVPSGSSTTVKFSVTVSPPPVIETSCKQIVKHSNGRKTCTYVCLKTINGLQDMDTATWFDNGDCDPQQSPGYPLTIYGPNSPQKTLMCAPCRNDVTFPHPEVCPENTQIGTTPFRIDLIGVDPVTGASVPYSVYCDYLNHVSQDQGFAGALGDDGIIYINGKQVRTYP